MWDPDLDNWLMSKIDEVLGSSESPVVLSTSGAVEETPGRGTVGEEKDCPSLSRCQDPEGPS